MPRQVDHEQRRVQLAEALWRLASSRGLEAVSLREVAAEAGVSMGRVQHYFPSKDEMLAYALELANDRAQTRIRARLEALEDPAPDRVLRECLYEMLGLSEESRQFILVGIAYFTRALGNPKIAETLSAGDAELHAFTAGLISAACQRDDLDVDTEARILWSLTTSLGVEVALGQISAEEAVATVDYYLNRIIGRPERQSH